MSEKRLWDTLKNGCGHIGHWDRIESHATAAGRPDVNACICGDVIDIELKIFEPKKGGFILRSSQNAWIQNRVRCGGRVWIFARYDDRFGNTSYILIPGSRSRELIHDRSATGWISQATKVWSGHVNWAQVLDVLRGMETETESPN